MKQEPSQSTRNDDIRGSTTIYKVTLVIGVRRDRCETPAKWDWNALIDDLDSDALLARDALVDGREEELLVVTQLEGGLVAVADETDFADVGGVVIENALSNKVVVSGEPWVEFETHNSEALSFDEAYVGIGFECIR